MDFAIKECVFEYGSECLNMVECVFEYDSILHLFHLVVVAVLKNTWENKFIISAVLKSP